MGRRRRVVLVGLWSAVLLGGLVAVLVVDGLHARRQLESARTDVLRLRTALSAGDVADAETALRDAQGSTRAAVSATDGPLWRGAAALPVAGRTVTAVRELARTVDDATRLVLPAAVEAGDALQPERLAGTPGQVDVAAVTAVAPLLVRASSDADRLSRRVAALDRPWVLSPVKTARDDLATSLTELSTQLRRASDAAAVLPPMLGGSGPRSYFVAFQNGAESRGTGGLVGAYGILTADAGRLSFSRLGDDRDLIGLPPPQLELGADFERFHGPHHRLWQNSNTTAHFPYAAALWLDMWERGTGQRLDGAFATDPVALSHLLAVAGPVELADGQLVTADDVVALTGEVAYERFADDNNARKSFLVSVSSAVVDHVVHDGAAEPRALLRALRRSASERRLLAFSTRPEEQALLATAGLAGEVPDAPGPFAAVVVNNAAGNKMDYYLDRDVRYELGPCGHLRRTSSITVRLHLDAPDRALPSYVTARLDRGAVDGPGSTLLNVGAYTAVGTRLEAAYEDGTQVAVFPRRERGHPVFVVPVELARGQSRVLRLDLVEPVSSAAPTVLVQPLVREQRTAVTAPPCL